MPIEESEVKALIAQALKEANEAFVGELKTVLDTQAKAHAKDIADTKAELAALKAAGAADAEAGAEGEGKSRGGRKVVDQAEVQSTQQLKALKAELDEAKTARQKAEAHAAQVAKSTALNEQFARVGINSGVLKQAAERLLGDRVVAEDGKFYVERVNRFGTKEAMTLEAFVDEWSAGEGQEFLPVRQGTSEAAPAGVRRPGLAKTMSLEEIKKAGQANTQARGGFNIG